MAFRDDEVTAAAASPKFLSGGGEMGARIRAHRWAGTALGPPDNWSQSLKTVVSILLSSRYAMWMLWGTERTFLCNDAYLPTLGVKGDWALGTPSNKVWEEIWPDIGPRIERVLTTGEATWDEALMLFLERRGFREETYHTFSYSPLASDDGTIVGMLCVVTEETERVIGERRLRFLRDLALRIADSRTAAQVWSAVGTSLEQDRHDLPWAIGYLFDETTEEARLISATGIEAGHPAAPPAIDVEAAGPWCLGEVRKDLKPFVLQKVGPEHGNLPSGAWCTPPLQAMIVPIPGRSKERPSGALILGLNPHRPMDTALEGFIDLFVGQIAAGLASAGAYEAERQRAEALAEIDRAKTAFFANVSHEFRTPLTLMLGPLEELLTQSPLGTVSEARRLAEVAHRNSVRLLRLVNALLDFSRIEGGRTQAEFESVDLAALTTDLASTFRAATDSAGLALDVICPPLTQPVCVDPAMWETIVLNLVSNAFKFTFEGKITVRLLEVEGMVQLDVSDTGTGIPEDEIPRLFERFHRVAGAKGRSIEGSGIGLALVRELVRLHGGRIVVNSDLGHGTTFTVSLPLGARDQAKERIATDRSQATTSLHAHAFVDEARRWLPDSGNDALLSDGAPAALSGRKDDKLTCCNRIVLADDNADLRDYIARLLRAAGYAVEPVADGAAALAAIRSERPDLVITDVMMPGLDGFDLLNAIRSEDALRQLPVIMLSARAGEDAKVEGLDAGADDYLTKPFSARELMARVAANLAMARMRREAAEAISATEARAVRVLAGMGEGYILLDRDFRVVEINDEGLRLERRPRDAIIGKTHWEAWPSSRDSVQGTLYRKAMTERVPVSLEFPFVWPAGHEAWIEVRAYPSGDGLAIFYRDINDRKQVEVQLRELNSTLEQRVEARSAELLQAEDALRQAQKMEAVGQLTGGLAHDFNNLLTGITGSLDLLSNRLDQGRFADLDRYIGAAQGAAKRAASLTHRLLAFSRRQTLDPRPTDVDQLIAGMVDLVRRTVGPSISVEVIGTGPLWPALVDPNQLENALLNLCINARDAMPDGGRLTIETANKVFDDRMARDRQVEPGPYLSLCVTDTGTGMAPDVIARAFDPFFTTKPLGMGTGLGLSMIYGFAQQSGGSIRVCSEEGHGTTMCLYLPRHDGELDPEDSAETVGSSLRAEVGETVLVVDDEPTVRMLVKEVLEELGYVAIEAKDGAAGLKVLQSPTRVDLLVTDVGLPGGLNGRQVADAGRVLRPALKVLFITGYAENAIVGSGHLDRNMQVMTKPFAMDALATRIRDMIEDR